MDGQQLFDVVEQYSDLGVHRAGTPVDDHTAAWMAGLLKERGVEVSAESVPFRGWEASSTLWIDDVEVEHTPVYYSWTGTIDTTSVDARHVDVGFGGKRVVLDPAFEAAQATGAEAAVFATGGPDGSLRVVNQKPELAYGLPAVLVAGRDLPAAGRPAVRLAMDASLVDATTTNLVGYNPAALRPGAGLPVILSTPLTGWFTCAGERGTGVAVLLDLVEQLADVPLLVLVTGGHELDYFGVRQWVGSAPPCRAVLHIGASVAVEADTPEGRGLAATRLAKTSVPKDDAGPMAERLTDLNLTLEAAASQWTGESEVFSALGVPMLSFSGAGKDFHTPQDIPSAATSPRALAQVARGFGDTIRSFLDVAP